MELRKSIFRFKQFDCSHSMSSMKIGVDAVLLGAWTNLESAEKILDVGTGCGVIALMCAQRKETAKITAIDVDSNSVKEASQNFNSSKWKNRLTCYNCNFLDFEEDKFDLIISNPPYFKSGVSNPNSSRLKARHEFELSPISLITKGKELLTHDGKISMIIPYERRSEILQVASYNGLSLNRQCFVRGMANSKIKRVMLEFSFKEKLTFTENLILELTPGTPTEQHRQLCKDFYLAY